MITKAEDAREYLRDFAHAEPFERFIVLMENGDRLLIEHPENLTVDFRPSGSRRLLIVSRGAVYAGSLESVTAAASRDVGQIMML